MSVRVVVADDHAVVRAGVRALVGAEPDLEVVGEASDARGAVEEAVRRLSHVVVLDLDMPGARGTGTIEDLRRAAPSARVAVLSMHVSPGHVRDAYAAGASGYVPKEAADTDLVDAIRMVAGGDAYVHPSLGASLAAAQIEEQRRAASDPLSKREREVAGLLARGFTNQEVARILSISVRTAETHRANAMRKLGLRSRADLVSYALEHGILRGGAEA